MKYHDDLIKEIINTQNSQYVELKSDYNYKNISLEYGLRTSCSIECNKGKLYKCHIFLIYNRLIDQIEHNYDKHIVLSNMYIKKPFRILSHPFLLIDNCIIPKNIYEIMDKLEYEEIIYKESEII